MNQTLIRARVLIRRHAFVLLVVLLVILLGIGYLLGYRPGPGLTFVRAGTLVLSNVPAGAVVYADETKRASSSGGDVRIALVPGNHSIIVDSAGNNPWSDLVNITARIDTNITPVFVPLKYTRLTLEPEDSTKAGAALAAYTLPAQQQALSMENGCANVYVSQNRVVASVASTTGCVPPAYLCVGGTCATTVIFAPVAQLRSVLPYPGRQDTLIVAYGDTLAVLELNPLKPQFFAPLVRGLAPVAAPWDANHIVVRDDMRTFLIAF